MNESKYSDMREWGMILLVVVTLMTQAQTKYTDIKLQAGNILFCGSTDGILSSAIDAVTQTHAQTHFTHMGVVEIVDGEVMVLHAAPKFGVCKQTLAEFTLSATGEVRKIHVYRLHNDYQHIIPKALQHANDLIGEPYDFTYVLESPGYYCSEFIQHIFAPWNIFELNPMTFKNPETNEFNETWQNHYAKLNMIIPEGKPGCNPNGMAASENIIYVGEL